MACLDHGIDECHLGYLGSLKSKWKSKWNYLKIEPTWKYGLKKNFLNFVFNIFNACLRYGLVDVSLWPVSAT